MLSKVGIIPNGSVLAVTVLVFLAAMSFTYFMFATFMPRQKALAVLLGVSDDPDVEVKRVRKKVRTTSLGYFAKMAKNAQAAGVDIKERELIMFTFLAFIGGFMVGYVISRSIYTAVALSLVGIFVPRYVINRRKKKRLKIIEAQMEEQTTRLASILEAGRTLPQAIHSVAADAPAPFGDELRIMDREISLGTIPEEALQHMADRLDSKDVKYLSQATSITQRAGGNLSLILRDVAAEIRDRRTFREKVTSMTTQQRMSGYFLALMAPGVAALMQFLDPGYFGHFFSSPAGLIVIGYAGGSIAMGIFMIRKMIGVVE